MPGWCHVMLVVLFNGTTSSCSHILAQIMFEWSIISGWWIHSLCYMTALEIRIISLSVNKGQACLLIEANWAQFLWWSEANRSLYLIRNLEKSGCQLVLALPPINGWMRCYLLLKEGQRSSQRLLQLPFIFQQIPTASPSSLFPITIGIAQSSPRL